MLCIVATDTTLSTVHLKALCDLVFQTMVFYLGLEELVNVKNIERLKKDLKVILIRSLNSLWNSNYFVFKIRCATL